VVRIDSKLLILGDIFLEAGENLVVKNRSIALRMQKTDKNGK